MRPTNISLPRSDKACAHGAVYWPIAIVAFLAGFTFFYHLGAAPLNDWDEAWHAEVSREILTTHDWLTLHYRGDVYFNKPPLTFWLRAIAFKAFGVSEWSARLGSALFGWASVVAVAWFGIRKFGPAVGSLAGMILCTSWLFTTYHAGRSGETDGTLVFFNIVTFVCLWRARMAPRWFYAAAIFTALAWMTKGGTAYLPWLAAAIITIIDRSQPRWNWRHALAGIALAFLLASPWQIIMLIKHGRAFFQAFYVHEAIDPAFGVSEGHGGDWAFHLTMLRLFFQPWLSLAGAAGLTILLLRERRPAARWVAAWGIIMLGACSLIPTKLIWYTAPALPPLALLASIAAVELARRRGGWIILGAAAALAIVQFSQPSWFSPAPVWAIALALGSAATLLISQASQFKISLAFAALCVAAPLILDGITLTRVLNHGAYAEEWLDRREADEPWREFTAHLAADYPGRSIMLIGFPQSPAGEFYLRRAMGDKNIQEASGPDAIASAPPQTILIMRYEVALMLKDPVPATLFVDQSLAALTKP